MSAPLVVAVAPGSPAEAAGLRPGDAVLRVNGRVPRDVIEWRLWSDEADVGLEVARSGIELELDVRKPRRQPLGAEVSSARVRPGPHVRQPLRVLLHLPAAQGPAPQPVPEGRRLPAELPVRELHDADPVHRGRPRARRHRAPVAAARQHPLHRPGAARPRCCATRVGRRACAGCGRCSTTASRSAASSWSARASTTARALDDTFAGILDEYPELSSVAVVPLGISRFNPEAAMRAHTVAEAAAVLDAVEDWQDVYRAALGRRLVHAADEYYLMADRPFPAAERYEGFPMHEDGIGMARTFELEFAGRSTDATGPRRGFFAAVDARLCVTAAEPGRRTPGCGRRVAGSAGRRCGRAASAPVGILSGRARRPRAGAARGRARPRRRAGHPGRATSSSAATPASPG